MRRFEDTRDTLLSLVSTTRVHGPSTRPVNSGSGNRALMSFLSLLASTQSTELEVHEESDGTVVTAVHFTVNE